MPPPSRIYNQGIEERIATFETEPRSAAQIEAQLAEKGDRYPTVVVERGGEVVAWAGAGPYRARGACAVVAESRPASTCGAKTGASRRPRVRPDFDTASTQESTSSARPG